MTLIMYLFFFAWQAIVFIVKSLKVRKEDSLKPLQPTKTLDWMFYWIIDEYFFKKLSKQKRIIILLIITMALIMFLWFLTESLMNINFFKKLSKQKRILILLIITMTLMYFVFFCMSSYCFYFLLLKVSLKVRKEDYSLKPLQPTKTFDWMF